LGEVEQLRRLARTGCSEDEHRLAQLGVDVADRQAGRQLELLAADPLDQVDGLAYGVGALVEGELDAGLLSERAALARLDVPGDLGEGKLDVARIARTVDGDRAPRSAPFPQLQSDDEQDAGNGSRPEPRDKRIEPRRGIATGTDVDRHGYDEKADEGTEDNPQSLSAHPCECGVRRCRMQERYPWQELNLLPPRS
jgi:hypothetical protein